MRRSADGDRGYAVVPHRAAGRVPLGRWGRLADLMQEKIHLLHDFLAYRRARLQSAGAAEEFHSLFRRFLAGTVGYRCLRVMFDPAADTSLGSNWLTADLREIERHAEETGTTRIAFADGIFDAVLCTGLERVRRPEALIDEVRRILVGNGQVWVQAPLSGPYFPLAEAIPNDYWRLTPDGLRLYMRGFDEILCSVFLPNGNALRSFSFFYGLRPDDDADELNDPGPHLPPT